MPMENWHSARLKDSSGYKDIVTLTLPGGKIQKIRGKSKSTGKMEDLSIRFKSSSYTPEQAKKWLKSHGYKSYSFHKAKPSGKKTKTKKGTKAELGTLLSASALYQGVIIMAEEDKTKSTETPTVPETTPRKQVLDDIFGNNQIHGGDFGQIKKRRVFPSVNYFTLLGGRQDAPMVDKPVKEQETEVPKETPKE